VLKIEEIFKAPDEFRRYNVGLCRIPQPGLYQTRCGLSQKAASLMPLAPWAKSLKMNRLAKRGVRDPHPNCVKWAGSRPLGQARIDDRTSPVPASRRLATDRAWPSFPP